MLELSRRAGESIVLHKAGDVIAWISPTPGQHYAQGCAVAIEWGPAAPLVSEIDDFEIYLEPDRRSTPSAVEINIGIQAGGIDIDREEVYDRRFPMRRRSRR